MHSSRKLRTFAFKIILGHVDDFAKQDDFMTLSCVELLEVIKDSRLNVPSEEFAVDKVIDRGNFSYMNKTELGKVFVNLRFCQLSN